MVTLTIDGKKVTVEENTTILKAALSVGIRIPTLCYFEKLNEIAACRICVVEIEGRDRLAASCNTLAEEGMVVFTCSPKVQSARRVNLQLILSQHKTECTTCSKNGHCSLQSLSEEFGLIENAYKTAARSNAWDKDFPLIRDNTKCIGCMRCIQVCDKIQGIHVWDLIGSGVRTEVNAKNRKLAETLDCSLCGQCITHCPVGALSERDDVEKVLSAIADPEKIVVAQIAPAVRSAWGDELGLSKSDATIERMSTALRKAGFNYVFDTSFAADLTIMEEGSELLERLKNAGSNKRSACTADNAGQTEHISAQTKLPMFTSCCPGWVRFVRNRYPELVPQLSSAKSPQQMFGAVIKNYWAEKSNIDPSKIFSVSIMPCTAKKAEQDIAGINAYRNGKDVDAVLTTRELVKLIRSSMISVDGLQEEELDSPLGQETGSGVIFGTTGGVMEAALRSAYYLVNGKNPEADAFKNVRSITDGWKEEEFELAGRTLKVAVTSGLGNAGKLIEALKKGTVSYDFVEIMACPGGCSGGGGQPVIDGIEQAHDRGKLLYEIDQNAAVRFSHENPEVQTIYNEYYGTPLSEKAHEQLHYVYK